MAQVNEPGLTGLQRMPSVVEPEQRHAVDTTFGQWNRCLAGKDQKMLI